MTTRVLGAGPTGPAPYTDVWVRGGLERRGERDCSPRYEAIRDRLAELAAPSVLDVGANSGYFGIRLAEDLGGQVTLVDDAPALPAIAAAQDNPALGVIPRRLTPKGLRQLARRDVVLALSVLHHFADWAAALEELRACRRWLFIEVPHPAERWMRVAASRRAVTDIHEAVSSLGELVCESERVGRDGHAYLRPTYIVAGTVRPFTGTVFSGSGTCSRKLPEQTDLPDRLGYRPYPGSLNLHADVDLGEPAVDYVGPKGRDYRFWPAWIDDVACHVMVPGRRGWPGSVEVVAPVSLRERFGLADGDGLEVDIRP
jgi:CTP-dependent riboflavin kinase